MEHILRLEHWKIQLIYNYLRVSSVLYNLFLATTLWSKQPRRAPVQLTNLHIWWCVTFICHFGFVLFFSEEVVFLFSVPSAQGKRGKLVSQTNKENSHMEARWICRNKRWVWMLILPNYWWFMKPSSPHHQIVQTQWIKGNSRLQKPLLFGSIWISLSILSVQNISVN